MAETHLTPKIYPMDWRSCRVVMEDDFKKAIKKMPRDIIAVVVPVRHGRVIETIEDGRMKRVFSCCGTDFTGITCWMRPNFCPNCGAKMDEVNL